MLLTGMLRGQGIHFESGTWEEAQAKAKHEKKMLLLVVCADWLDVCPIMQADIFTDPEVGAAYNARFISWQLDAATLDGQLYFGGIRLLSIPEFIFFNADGQPQYRAKKFKDQAEMLAMAAAARDPQNHLATLHQRYLAGQRDPAWLTRYLLEMDAAGHDMTLPCQAYLQKLPAERLLQTENWVIAGIGVQKISDPAFRYVLAHRDAFNGQYGEEGVNAFILRVYRLALTEAVTRQDRKLLGDCQSVVRALLGEEEAPPVILQDELTFLAAGRQWAAYTQKATALFQILPDQDPYIYNDVAWNLCQYATDSATLQLAAHWAQLSVDYGPAYWNWHTLGSLQLKNGDPDAALHAAQQAMTLAAPDSKESEEVQALLDLIEKSR